MVSLKTGKHNHILAPKRPLPEIFHQKQCFSTFLHVSEKAERISVGLAREKKDYRECNEGSEHNI